MSVVIRGMKMPKACINCDVYIAHDYCDHFAQFGTGARKDGRYDDCPLIEIPTSHGRLIDADALFQDLIEHNIPFNNDINSAVNVAPTILEAEGERRNKQ